MTVREQRLLVIFGVAVLAAGSYVGWTKVMARVQAWEEETVRLNRQADWDRSTVESQRQRTEEARKWLETRLGEPIDEQEALSRLLQIAQQTASMAGLTLSDPKFGVPEQKGELSLARLSAEVTGSEQSIYPWLVGFHQPDQLRAVRGINVTPDKKDDTLIKCEVEFAQWYLPSDREEQPQG